jgi:hypothetical protein
LLTPAETALKTYFEGRLLQYGALRPDGIPYNNSAPIALPGKIEAEQYDYGVEGQTYHDTTADANQTGVKRTDDVDITSVGGANVISSIAAGEWLEYTVCAPSNGSYLVVVRYAAASTGGSLHFEIDGAPVSGVLSLPPTGAFTTYSSATLDPVQIPDCTNKLTLVFDQPGMNIDHFTFSYEGPPVTPPVDDVQVWSEAFDVAPTNVEQTAEFILGGATPTPGFDTNIWAVSGNPTKVGFDENPGTVTTLASYDTGVPRLRAVGIVLGAAMFTEGNGTYRLSYDVELSGITDATNDYGQILVYSGTGYNDTDSYYTMDVTRLSPQVISFDGTGSATTAPLADSGPIVTTTNGAGLVFEYAGGDVALTFASPIVWISTSSVRLTPSAL